MDALKSGTDIGKYGEDVFTKAGLKPRRLNTVSVL